MKKNRICVQTILFGIRGYFEISVLEISRGAVGIFLGPVVQN